jgi:hypothetical protein
LGITWNVLGNVGTGVNWYNIASLLSSGLPAWSGNFGWSNATHTLTVLNNEPIVRFRFVFTSDASITYNVCLLLTTDIDENNVMQEDFFLDSNFPNPFNHNTSISYFIPENGLVEIFISDITGKKIAIPVNEIQQKGIHKIEIESSDFSPGVYFYTMKFGNKMLTKKMMVME